MAAMKAGEKQSLLELVYGSKNPAKGKVATKAPSQSQLPGPTNNVAVTSNVAAAYQGNPAGKRKGWLPFRRNKTPKAAGDLQNSSRFESMSNLDSKPYGGAVDAPKKKKYSNEFVSPSGNSPLAKQNAKWSSMPEIPNMSGDYRPRATSPLPAQNEEEEAATDEDDYGRGRLHSCEEEVLEEDADAAAIEELINDAVEAGERELKRRPRADSLSSINTFNSILNSFELAIDAGKQAGYSDQVVAQILDDSVDDSVIDSNLSNLLTHNRQSSNPPQSVPDSTVQEASSRPGKAYEDAKLHSQVQRADRVSKPEHRSTASASSSDSTLSESSASDSVTNSNQLRNQPQIEQAHRFNAATVAKGNESSIVSLSVPKADGPATKGTLSAVETITVSSVVKPDHQRTSSHDMAVMKTEARGSAAALLTAFDAANLGKTNQVNNPATSGGTTPSSVSGPTVSATMSHTRSTSGGEVRQSIKGEEALKSPLETVAVAGSDSVTKTSSKPPSDGQKVIAKTAVTEKAVTVATPDAVRRFPSQQRVSAPKSGEQSVEAVRSSGNTASVVVPDTTGSSASAAKLISELNASAKSDSSTPPRITTYSRWRQVGPGTNVNPHSFIPPAHLSVSKARKTDGEKAGNANFAERVRRSQSVGGAKARELERERDRDRSRSPEVRRRLPPATANADNANAQRSQKRERELDAQSAANSAAEHAAFRSSVELKLTSVAEQQRNVQNASNGGRVSNARPGLGSQQSVPAKAANRLPNAPPAQPMYRQPLTTQASVTSGIVRPAVTTSTSSLAQAPTAAATSATTATNVSKTAAPVKATQSGNPPVKSSVTLRASSTAGAAQKPLATQSQSSFSSNTKTLPSSSSTETVKSDADLHGSTVETVGAVFGVRLTPAERRATTVVTDSPAMRTVAAQMRENGGRQRFKTTTVQISAGDLLLDTYRNSTGSRLLETA